MTKTSDYDAGAEAEASRRAAAPAEFPDVPADLMAALERIFPDRCPDGALSNDEIRERIGEARVLRFLRRQAARRARKGLERIF